MDKTDFPDKRKGLANRVLPAKKSRAKLVPKVSAKGKVTIPREK